MRMYSSNRHMLFEAGNLLAFVEVYMSNIVNTCRPIYHCFKVLTTENIGLFGQS